MRVEHIGVWVTDIEKMRKFYERYFNAKASELYHNTKTGFRSYFMELEKGCRIELTNKQHLSNRISESLGYTHLAIAVGSKDRVDKMTERFVKDGFPLLNGPRVTGDGYYEAVIQDPEGNLIELTTD